MQSFFKQALQTVEQGIDKALDIKEGSAPVETPVLSSASDQKAGPVQEPKSETADIQAPAEVAIVTETAAETAAEQGSEPAQLNEQEVLINQLREEGKRISTQNAKLTTLYKKIRDKERESADKLEVLQQKQQDSQLIVRKLEERSQQLESDNGKLLKLVAQSEIQSQQQAKRQSQVEQQLQDCDFTVQELNQQLAKVKDELNTVLHEKDKLVRLSDADEVQKYQSQLQKVKQALDTERQQSETLQQQHLQEVKQHKLLMIQQDQDHQHRTDTLHSELRQVTMQLETARRTNEDLSQQMNEYTRPLVKQLDTQQQMHANTVRSYEQQEQVLSQRVQQLTLRNEQLESDVRSLKRDLQLSDSRVKQRDEQLSANDSQLVKLQEHAHELTTQLDQQNVRVKALQQQLTSVSSEHQQALAVMQNYHQLQLDVKSDEFEVIRSQLNDKIRNLEILKSQEETRRVSQATLPPVSAAGTSPSSPLGMLSIHEPDTTQLGELFKSTEARNVELTHKVQEMQTKATQFDTLQQKYDMTLELLGEQTERVQELQQDIADMRQAYRTQLDDLLTRLESVNK